MDNLKLFRVNAKPSKPDSRDLVYLPTSISLPDSIDLREYDSRIEQQGQLGSCTANAITSGYEVLVNILYPESFKELSRLYVYYHSRMFADYLDKDAGSYIRDGLKSIKNYGVCTEELWPYYVEDFDKQPQPKCYLDASKRKITSYNVLFTNDEIKEVLAAKKPVVLGMEIFYDFTTVNKDNPNIKMPVTYAFSLGNHAVLVMGYDDSTSSFLIKNSYGVDWGDKGYAWLPYDYVENFSVEKWCFDINNQNTIL